MIRPDPKHLLALVLIGLGAALWTASGAAQTEQSNEEAEQEEPPLVVESDEVVIRDSEQKAIYTGNVKATKGEMILRSDRLVVHYNDNGIQRAHATGEPVTMEQGKRRGRSEEAFYDASDRSLLLVGNAHVEEGPNTLEGARIRYFLDNRRTEAFAGEEEEGGRARAVFQSGGSSEEDSSENSSAEGQSTEGEPAE